MLAAMNTKQLRTLLRKHDNLSELAKTANVNVRTLRRIKSGESTRAHALTIEAVAKALAK